MTISTAVDVSARASVVGIKTEYQQLGGTTAVLLPQAVALIGQGNTAQTYSTDKAVYTRARDVAEVYGYGSPLHMASRQLLPENNDGLRSIPLTVYPLDDAAGAIAAAGDITTVNAATEVGSYRVRIANVLSEAFLISPGDTLPDIHTAMIAAINAVLEMPVVASDNTTDVTLTAKWAGSSGNLTNVSVEGPSVGVTFATTDLTGGATNPDVQTALDQFGDSWETIVVNCMDLADTTTLDALATFNEGRWGPLTRRPFVALLGSNPDTVTPTGSSPRPNDRTNVVIPAMSSNSMGHEIAARAAARIARVANNTPANDYLRQLLSGIAAGPDSAQLNYAQRDLLVKSGSSTTVLVGGIVSLEDTVTFYRPVGEQNPAYAKVCQIVKLQNIIYNLDRIFTADSWAGAPLIPDIQSTTNPAAKRPKDAKAEVAALIDQLGLAAMISDPETAKGTIITGINATNPNRLDVAFTVQLSGNTNIISIDLNFGFFFG